MSDFDAKRRANHAVIPLSIIQIIAAAFTGLCVLFFLPFSPEISNWMLLASGFFIGDGVRHWLDWK